MQSLARMSERSALTANSVTLQSPLKILQSVKSYLMGCYLEDNAISQAILEDITHHKGILSVLTTDSHFTDWTSAKIKFQEWVTPELYEVIEKEARDDINNLLKKHNKKKFDDGSFSEVEIGSCKNLQLNTFFKRPLEEVAIELNIKLKSSAAGR